ncbi:T9SS type A sorting domain-containing protein [Bacteroidota bacterium]
MILYVGIFFILFIGQKEIYAQSYLSSFEFEGLIRKYEVNLPQNFQANMPVVFCIHGWTEDINWIRDYTKLHRFADTSGFIIVYPNAYGIGWNIGHPLTESNSRVNDVGFISALIDTLHAQYNIDLSRVFCCGYSMGGEMTYKLAGELGQRFAAVASIAGLLNESTVKTCKPVRPFPILHMHGTLDTYETWNGTKYNTLPVEETINIWLEKNGCSIPGDTILLPDIDPSDGCRVEKISYTNCSGDGQLIFYKIPTGGHHWPGSPGWTDGKRNMDIHASAEILNFFKQFENPLIGIAYAKSLEVNPFYIQSQSDTIKVRAIVSNQEEHAIKVLANIQGDQSQFMDSLQLFDDGLHGDSDSSDNIWGNIKLASGFSEDAYKVDIITYDSTFNKICTAQLGRFIKFGPLSLAENPFSENGDGFHPGQASFIKLNLQNNSTTTTATKIRVRLSSPDSLIVTWDYFTSCADIAAGEIAESSTKKIEVSAACPVGTKIPFVVDIAFEHHICWSDTFYILIEQKPVSIKNTIDPIISIYPNPIEDLLTIETYIPQHLSIEISSLNGQLIYSREMEGSSHQIDLSSLQRGVYFITVRSKDFVRTEKIIKL